ncbi:MAG: preprotein translocase subunit SecG [Candidatus Symbiothrix sp.]|jgi:preprotein translocase subunit SecG|nr:preprotein translocase subunit SecG [Candidatus Symbiothrix sp.]
MYIFITVLIVVAAILLALIVVIQNSKGGGLAAGFASSNQVMGVRKTNDVLEKATWWLATIVVVLCLGASFTMSRGTVIESDNVTKEILDLAVPQQNTNQAPQFEPTVTEEAPAAPAVPQQ